MIPAGSESRFQRGRFTLLPNNPRPVELHVLSHVSLTFRPLVSYYAYHRSPALPTAFSSQQRVPIAGSTFGVTAGLFVPSAQVRRANQPHLLDAVNTGGDRCGQPKTTDGSGTRSRASHWKIRQPTSV